MSVIAEKTVEDDPVSSPEPLPRKRRTLERSFGLIAGILFIGGSFAGLPSSLLIDPAPPASLYLISAAGVAAGLAAMVIAWDRISPRWAHVAMLFAIVQVGLTVALAGDPFVFYFVFIAIFAAYAFGERNQVAIYVGLIAIALLVPILVIPDSTRATAAQALAAIPAIILVAVMVAFLRERLEDNRRTTRRFAREALALSVRIGRLPPPAPAPAPVHASGQGSQIAHPFWRRSAIGTSAVLVVLSGLGALAAVGVALPGPIESSFAKVGIEHSDGSSTPTHLVRRQANPASSGSAATASARSEHPRPVEAAAHNHKHASAKRRIAHAGGDGPSETSAALGGGAAAPAAAATAQSQSGSPTASASTPSSGDGGSGPQPSGGTSETATPPTVAAPIKPPAPVKPPSGLQDVPHLGQQIESTLGSILGQHPNK